MARTYFFWDPLSDNILQERDETGAVTAEYTAEPGLYGNVISQNRGGVESQFHYDAQGSTLAVTDDNQNVTDTFAYSAFGEVTERTGTTEVPFQYIGQKGYYTDGLTGQIMVRRRPYEPARARWMSPDILAPFLPKMTPYAYAANSPLKYADPSGNYPCDCCCCVLDADIQLLGKSDKTIPREEGDIRVWGHRFQHIANLLNGSGAPGKCRLQWFECPSRATPQMREKGKKDGEWYEAHGFYGDVSETTRAWLDYERDNPPYDALDCNSSFDLVSEDYPQVLKPTTRIALFAIRVTSAPGCGCATQSATSYATQILYPAVGDDPAKQEFQIGILRHDLLSTCGPVPG